MGPVARLSPHVRLCDLVVGLAAATHGHPRESEPAYQNGQNPVHVTSFGCLHPSQSQCPARERPEACSGVKSERAAGARPAIALAEMSRGSRRFEPIRLEKRG